MPSSLNSLLTLYRERGQVQYGGEAVSQLDHALQCATLAEQANASKALIAACLLHDLGHLIHYLGEDAALRGLDDRHECRVIPVLKPLFPPAVTTPIQLHVAAKRYLCSVELGYWSSLSKTSKRSLDLQGGPLKAPEAAAFIQQPYAEDAVNLRRWDDLSKVPKQPTPDLKHFETILLAV